MYIRSKSKKQGLAVPEVCFQCHCWVLDSTQAMTPAWPPLQPYEVRANTSFTYPPVINHLYVHYRTDMIYQDFINAHDFHHEKKKYGQFQRYGRDICSQNLKYKFSENAFNTNILNRLFIYS